MRKTIVVTGERAGSKRLAAQIERLGVRAIPVPTIRLVPKKLSARSRAALKNFTDFDYVFFTSAHAVEFFCKSVRKRRLPSAGAAEIIAVGPSTALACAERSLHARVLAETFSAMKMARAIRVTKGARILFPRSLIASNDSVRELRTRGAEVTIVPLYTTIPARIPKTSLAKKMPDFIVFMSASSVRSFSKQMRDMLTVPAVVIGRQTADACAAAGFSKISIAKESTTTGIVKLLRSLL